LIVCAEQARVEVELLGGLLGCPSCREVLGPWGHARERVLRCRSGDRLLVPRRARCRGCLGTHVLLPEVVFLRRQDGVVVIGEAIEAGVAGEGCRRIASRLGVPADTVRGWLRRFVGRAELIRALFTRCAVVLDPLLGSVLPAGERRRGCVGGGGGRRSGVGVAVRSAAGVADRQSLVGGRAVVWQHEFPRDSSVVS
jgi:hypothetical protein